MEQDEVLKNLFINGSDGFKFFSPAWDAEYPITNFMPFTNVVMSVDPATNKETEVKREIMFITKGKKEGYIRVLTKEQLEEELNRDFVEEQKSKFLQDFYKGDEVAKLKEQSKESLPSLMKKRIEAYRRVAEYYTYYKQLVPSITESNSQLILLKDRRGGYLMTEEIHKENLKKETEYFNTYIKKKIKLGENVIKDWLEAKGCQLLYNQIVTGLEKVLKEEREKKFGKQ